MKLHVLRYLIAVVENENFSRAAEKLFVSQPALSKAFSELEKELNCQLFERKGKKIELTDQGNIVYQEALKIVALCDAIPDKIQGTTKPLSLKIGYIIYGHMEHFLKCFQNVFNDNNIDIIPLYESSNIVLDLYKKEALDLVLTSSVGFKPLKTDNVYRLTKEKFKIIVHKDHYLNHKEKVFFDDLKDIKIINWDKNEHEIVSNCYEEILKMHHLDTNVVGYAKKMGDLVFQMKKHTAIGLAGSTTSTHIAEDFRCVEIDDSNEDYGVNIIWKKSNNNPALMKLIEML